MTCVTRSLCDRNIETVMSRRRVTGAKDFIRILHHLIVKEYVSFKFPNDINVVSSGRLHETIKTLSSKFQVFLLEQSDWRNRYKG